MYNFLSFILISSTWFEARAVENSLIAVHLIFRHGDRCPEKTNLYESSQYYNESYFKPYGFGQLTNKGKLTAYNLGKEIRQRYTGFLDESYRYDLIEARSSDFNRTKESLEVMLAGLFPPTQELTWLTGFDWIPIAYNYIQRSEDEELFCFGCPAWDPTINKYLATANGTMLLQKYKWVFDYLTNKTMEPYDILKAYYLYFGFQILEQLNYTLPSWSSTVYPQVLTNLTMEYYDLITASNTIRQMTGGYLVKHILQDTQEKIDGKIPRKKMFIWSGHENNIVAVLAILKNWSKQEMVKYGSYISMELHNINNTYGFKIYYKNDADGPKVLKLPQCEEFCPLEMFKLITKDDIPDNLSVCRGKASSLQKRSQIQYVIVFTTMLVSKYLF